MSIEQVNQFYQAVLQNPELQLQLQLATDDESLAEMAVEVGQQHGYTFTTEEVIQAIALAQSSTEATGVVELADEQLEAVAGGKGSVQDAMEEGKKGAQTGQGIGMMAGLAVPGMGMFAGGAAGRAVGGAVGFVRGLFG